MIRVDVTVDDIAQVIAAGYTLIRVYTDTESGGAFSTLDGTITLVANTGGYQYVDTDGSTSTWYRVAYYGAGPGESEKSTAQQGGTVDAYCTALDVRSELSTGSGQISISDKYEDALWDMCVQCSRLIDRYKDLEEGAYLASGSEVRYFDGSGDAWLWLGTPAVSISAVAVEETDGTWTTWASTDYFEWPYNSTPIKRLDVQDRSGTTKGAWTAGRKRVKITGVWGITTTVPDLIARAARTQVARWYKMAQQGWQEAGQVVEFGFMRYERRIDPDIRVMLDRAKPRRRIM